MASSPSFAAKHILRPMTMEGTRRQLLRIAGWGALFGAAGLPAFAEEPANPDAALYSAYAIVTGTDMRQRPWGFAQCLKEVLVKVAGDPRLKDDTRVANLADRADRYVASFDYADLMAGIPKKDDQGSYDRPHRLTVHFDPAKIDALLAELGDKPWRGQRPVVVPVLLVAGPKPPSYLLSAEIPRGDEQRGAFAEAVSEFGMSVRIPTEAELGAWVATIDNFAPKPPATDGSEAIVTGSLEWNESLPGWIGQWRTRWNGVDHRWGIGGVNYDAAFRDIVRGVVLLASGRGSPD
jgi:hypothetical protein